MLKKVLIGVGVFLLLLIVAVIAAPFVFKDKINAKLKEAINKEIDAKVDYGDYSLSLIRSFPNFSLSLDDLSVVGINEFKGDTLAYVKNLNITVDLMTVIKGEKYKILALNIIEPTIHAKVNYKEKPNWDVTKPDDKSSEPTAFAIEIKKYKIEKGEITYDDKAGNTSAIIHNLNFEGSGDVTNDLYELVTKTSIDELTYKSGAVAYLSKAKLVADMNLSVDNRNSKYTFKENTISLNDLGLQFDGFVAMPDNAPMNMDLKFKSKKTEFKSLLSLIPAVYEKDFDKIKTSGSLTLEGDAKGIYKDSTNYPAFNLKLNVNNAMFQYPSLPVAVKDINIATTINKLQGGLDLTVIDISKLHMVAGTDPVDAVIHIKTPVSNPDVAANITGKVDLGNVPKLYPMEGVKTISGLLTMALNFKARKSDIDKKNYSAIQASGNAKIANLVYESKETPMPVRIPAMQMTFNPKNVTLDNLTAVLGKSDFNASGTLDNFMPYFLGKGDLSGTLNLKSTVFDANQWLQKDKAAPATTSGSKPAAADTANATYFKVPAHIDFTANAQFGKIYYEKMTLENVKGEVVIRDEAINLNNLFANLLGGSANLNVKYNTKATDHPDVTFNYDIKNLNIQQTYKAVDMASKMAPVIKQIQGNFSSNLKGSGKLKPDMSVDYNSLLGDGRVDIPYAKVVDLPVLGEIGKVAKIPALQNIELKNAWTVLKFKNGRVAVDPNDLKFGNGYNLHYEGSNGFDQTLDYDMRLDVPTKELGSAATAAQNLLSQIPGMSASMPASFGFVFKVTGTAAKPTVKLSKVVPGTGSAGGTSPATDIKKQAQDELQKQKQAAEQSAKDAANKAKQDAEQKAKEAAEKAKKDAQDKLKKVLKFPK